eukprot:XP_025002710.1 WD repeat-containing protein 73 isoform X1 [Gallus gallus]
MEAAGERGEEEEEEEWLLQSLHLYEALHAFELQAPTRVIEWALGKRVCVAGYGCAGRNEILQLLPPPALQAKESRGLCPERDFKVECGGFSNRPVYNLKHVPDTRTRSHSILPRRSWKRPSLTLLESRVATSLPCFPLAGYRAPQPRGICPKGCSQPPPLQAVPPCLSVQGSAAHLSPLAPAPPESGGFHRCLPGASCLVCASLCRSSSRCQGGCSPPVTTARKRPYRLPDQAARNKHPPQRPPP